jgi:hypothetical protein
MSLVEGSAGVLARAVGPRASVREGVGGQLVYSTSSMLRLIEATGGDIVGANLDPSHLMWMGADIPTVIRTLGDAIFHVYAKDIRINDWISARDGLLDTVPITEPGSRAWNYGRSDSAIPAARPPGPTWRTTYGTLAMTAR